MKDSLPNKKTNKILKKIFIALFWLLIWEIVYLIIDREIYLPSPISTFKIFLTLLSDSSTYYIIFVSSVRTFAGLIISILLGTTLGMLCGLNRAIDDFINPIVIIIRSTPIVSIIIIAIIWFSSTNVPVFVSILMCSPIIFANTKQGIQSADVDILEMLSVFKVKKYKMITKVYIHYVFPYLISAIISTIGIAWKATTAAEVLSIPKYSIGKYLFYSKTSLDPASLFAWTLIIILMSTLFEIIFRRYILKKEDNYDKD